MAQKVVVLNGPKMCGKDVAADHIVNISGGQIEKRFFKDKLFELTMCVYNMEPDEFWRIYDDRVLKETPMDVFYGLSVRQAMINVSENMIKPHVSDDYFAMSLIDAIQKSGAPGIISDGGFDVEMERLATNLGSDNVLLVRIWRPDHTFEGDSRNYINESGLWRSVDVSNSGTEEEYLKMIEQITIPFLLERDDVP